MSTYVMSDIHGHFDEFLSMLNLIEFKENDTLYILGDIIDRGTKSLLLFDYIVSHKNIHLLKGNHEKLFEEYYETNNNSLWFENGGNSTFSELKLKDKEYIDNMYKYIKNTPTIKLVDNFLLVHAELFYPENYKELNIDELLENEHSPTCRSGGVFTLNRNGLIYIDCGVYRKSDGKLACLRLNDMKEFYIERKTKLLN